MIITPNAVNYVATLSNIGLNPAQIATFDTITGVSDVRIFHSVDDTQKYFESVAKQIRVTTPFPFTATSSIIAFRHWVNFMVARQQDPDPVLFAATPDHLSKWITRKSEILENRLLTASLADLKLNKFTDMDKWNAFRGDVRAKLQSYRDAKYGIFLSVLVREHTDVTPEMLTKTYDSLEEELSETIILTDPFLDRDNKYLFAAISECTSTGQLGTYIRKFEKKGDGRGAYLELLTACNNPEMKDLRKEKLKDKLRNTKWTRHLSIEKYTQTHIEIHNLMADAGVDFSEMDKIYWYTYNSKAHNIGNNIALAMATQATPTTFDACVASFRRAMANNDNTPMESETRRISASERNPRRQDSRTDNRSRSKSTGSGTRRSKPAVPPKGAADCPPGYLTKHGYQPKKIYGYFTDNSTVPIHLESYKSDIYDLILKSDADKAKLQEVRATHSRQVKAVETLEYNLSHSSWRDSKGDYHLRNDITHGFHDDSSVGSASVTSQSVASHSSRHSHYSSSRRQAASLMSAATIPDQRDNREVYTNTSVNQFGHPRSGPRRINNSPAWTTRLEATKRAQPAATTVAAEPSKDTSITWGNNLKPAAQKFSPSESIAYKEAKQEKRLKRAKASANDQSSPTRAWVAYDVVTGSPVRDDEEGTTPLVAIGDGEDWTVPTNHWKGASTSWTNSNPKPGFDSRPSVKRVIAATSSSHPPTRPKLPPTRPRPSPPPTGVASIPQTEMTSTSPMTAITQAAATMASAVQTANAAGYDSDSEEDSKPAYDLTKDPTFLAHLAAITAMLNPPSSEPIPALDTINIAETAEATSVAPAIDELIPMSTSYSSVSAISTEPILPQKRVRKPTTFVPFNTLTRNSKRKDPPKHL